MIARFRALLALSVGLLVAPLGAQNGKTVKVFILAGQSNMEGKVQNTLLEYQAKAEKTGFYFEHLRKNGKWIVRDDVFIKFLKRKGPLTIGYGSRGRTGVELEFGTVLGNHFKEPVLLIKTAWGGHSLFKMFRSPSAGLPGEAQLEKELANAVARTKKRNEKRRKQHEAKGNDRPFKPDPLPTMDEIRGAYGSSYRNMMREVKSTLANCGKLFPALAGKKLELAGFVWFQGWNDQYGGAEADYEPNLIHFIKDVRKDLDAPELPFVIGVMGQNGSKPAQGAMQIIQEAQLAMENVTEFKDNVRAVRTDVLVDRAAEVLYPTWRKNIERWKTTGSDHAYHYFGSAIWHLRIGDAFARAMLELIGMRK